MITQKEAIDLLSRVAEKLAYRGIEPASDIEKLRVLEHQIREETFILPTTTIEKGQIYITKSKTDTYAGLKLVVTKVEGDARDDLVHYRTEPKKDKTKDTCRVWWIKDCCYRVWG